MLRRADSRCSVRLANIGSGERRQRDRLAIWLNNTAHTVAGHDDPDVPNVPFKPATVPGYLAEETASPPAMSRPHQVEVMSCVFLSMNGIEALDFSQGSPIS
jgi:hypothetical protein